MEDLWLNLIEASDQETMRSRLRIQRVPETPDYGGIQAELLDVKPTAMWLPHGVACYLCASSRWHQDQGLLEDLHHAVVFIQKYQHEDGSFDYPSCNYHSAPDTSFVLEALYLAWCILKKKDTTQELTGVLSILEEIFAKSLTILLTGGFHTPNHRWAICSSLMQLRKWAKDQTQVDARLEQFLAEGIDINEDGEYAEKSTGNYNAVVNSSLLNIFTETKDAYYLECVMKNLSSMKDFLENDQTIFTNASSRQDRGKKVYMHAYFIQYLRVYQETHGDFYGAMAHQIWKTSERIRQFPLAFPYVFLDPTLLPVSLPSIDILPREYKRFNKESQLLRVNKNLFSYTLLGGQSTFSYLRFADFAIECKMGQSLCEKRYFEAEEMSVGEMEHTLSQTMDAWYYLPFESRIDTSDWWAMNHELRPKTVLGELHSTVHVSELPYGLDFHVKAEGIDRFPLRFEMHLPEDTIVRSQHLYTKGKNGQLLILREKKISLTYNGVTVHVEGFIGEHEFLAHYSNEESKDSSFILAATAYAPADFHLRVYLDEEAAELLSIGGISE